MVLSTFLQSVMVTKKSTESIQKTEAIKCVVSICNPITYNLPLSEDRLLNLHSVTEVKTERLPSLNICEQNETRKPNRVVVTIELTFSESVQPGQTFSGCKVY